MADKKQAREAYVLVGLLVVAALVWYFEFSGRPAAAGFSAGNQTYTPINAQDFSDIWGKLNAAQSTEYKSTGRNIFVAGAVPSADPDAPKAVVKSPFRIIGPNPKEPDPPAQLSMTFFGYGNLPSGGPRRAFLLDKEDVFIVGEGETVQNRIRILHIGNESIEFEDINTHQRGSKPIEASPATPAA
jgi:hypothetical protein